MLTVCEILYNHLKLTNNSIKAIGSYNNINLFAFKIKRKPSN